MIDSTKKVINQGYSNGIKSMVLNIFIPLANGVTQILQTCHDSHSALIELSFELAIFVLFQIIWWVFAN